MPQAGDIRAAGVYAELSVQDALFSAGLAAASQKLQQFANQTSTTMAKVNVAAIGGADVAGSLIPALHMRGGQEYIRAATTTLDFMTLGIKALRGETVDWQAELEKLPMGFGELSKAMRAFTEAVIFPSADADTAAMKRRIEAMTKQEVGLASLIDMEEKLAATAALAAAPDELSRSLLKVGQDADAATAALLKLQIASGKIPTPGGGYEKALENVGTIRAAAEKKVTDAEAIRRLDERAKGLADLDRLADETDRVARLEWDDRLSFFREQETFRSGPYEYMAPKIYAGASAFAGAGRNAALIGPGNFMERLVSTCDSILQEIRGRTSDVAQ